MNSRDFFKVSTLISVLRMEERCLASYWSSLWRFIQSTNRFELRLNFKIRLDVKDSKNDKNQSINKIKNNMIEINILSRRNWIHSNFEIIFFSFSPCFLKKTRYQDSSNWKNNKKTNVAFWKSEEWLNWTARQEDAFETCELNIQNQDKSRQKIISFWSWLKSVRSEIASPSNQQWCRLCCCCFSSQIK